MAHNTGIEWTHIPGYKGETWNPVLGCSVVSPGCTNCYAMRMAGRLEAMGTAHYAGTTKASKAGPVWTGRIAQAPEKTLTKPLSWAKPRAVFVNSMGDLFHEDVPDGWIDRVFAVMALCPQHIFMILTKRADRMRAYTRSTVRTPLILDTVLRRDKAIVTSEMELRAALEPWPLPNVWLGVSVEDQARANERIPYLLTTPAAVRFASAEPLLGPVDLTRICLAPQRPGSVRAGIHLDALAGKYWESGQPYIGEWDVTQPYPEGSPQISLDWVIAGGESGKGARPMHPDWARGLRDQCKTAGVPFFFKQWGEWANRGRLFGPEGHTEETAEADAWLDTCSVQLEDGTVWHDPDRIRLLDRFGHNWANENAQPPPCVHVMTRSGKARAGHKLDGKTHHNWPEAGA